MEVPQHGELFGQIFGRKEDDEVAESLVVNGVNDDDDNSGEENAATGIPDMEALNPAQAKAVAAALSNPLTIIQGPPGTGKTKVSPPS